MDLNQLIYRRLTENTDIAERLTTYDGEPAVFNSEFPSDQQEGWEQPQYPRVLFRVNMQANAERSSAGTLMISVYGLTEPLVLEELEALIRGSLKDVLIQPSDNAPFCFAWSGTQPYQIEGTAILAKEMIFDILEYPQQITAQPDPIETMQTYFKKHFPDMFVVGLDSMTDFMQGDEEHPICYVQQITNGIDHMTYAVAWWDCNISVHLICPDKDARTRWLRRILTRLSMDGEAIMPGDIGTPMRFVNFSGNNTSDYLRTGQISLQTQYGTVRIECDSEADMGEIKFV